MVLTATIVESERAPDCNTADAESMQAVQLKTLTFWFATMINVKGGTVMQITLVLCAAHVLRNDSSAESPGH